MRVPRFADGQEPTILGTDSAVDLIAKRKGGRLLRWRLPLPASREGFGECLAFAQVDEHEQGLLPGVQLPPPRPGRRPVTADDPGRVSEGPGRQRQRGAVKSMEAPGGSEAFLVDRLTYQGLLWSRQSHLHCG